MHSPSPNAYQALVAGAVLALFVIVACAPATRYRVLSSVFDGVPPPPGVTPRPSSEIIEVARVRPGIPAPQRDDSLLPKIGSVHAPVREHRCRECHTDLTRIDLVPRDASLCDKCHFEQRVTEGWDHGPINLGTCVPCHDPHDSVNPSLLMQPIPDLCLQCHQDTLERDVPEHEVENINQCVECHDPHAMY